jgi:single-stranded-DNA-specific exonuclease
VETSQATHIWKARGRDQDSQPLPPQAEAAPSGLPRLVWDVMRARGFKDEDAIQKWLNPSLKILKDPYTLFDMEKAIARLVKARENQESVVIYADYDLDGTSGLALLLTAFKWLGFENVGYYQPKRLSEGYGLHNHAIQKLYDEGRRLLLSVDLGITAVEEVEFANSLGMECIITDHHLPKEKLPEAVAVVNPNRGNCPSGLSHLCGTGVAFYLVLALKRALLEQGLLTPEQNFDPKALLDCFVIGTVTDMVPLIDENRVLVKHGLMQLAQTKRPGLRVLMQALGLWGNPLTSGDVAIRFAPKLNALSRMEMGVQPIDLYIVDDEKKAQALVETVLSNNQDRQASQRSAEAEAMAQVQSRPLGSSIFVYSKNFHRGVVGLVATKLCQEFGLPTYVGSLDETDGIIVGSARMPEGRGLNALDAMCSATDALDQFGGHAVAAGFELPEKNAELFRERLEDFFSKKSVQAEARVWFYDTEATLDELSPAFMTWYEHLSPFGAQFSPPIFCLQGVKITQIKELKGGHYRLTLGDNGITRTALWFSPPKGHPALALLTGSGATTGKIDALVEPQWNYFNGSRSLQFLIQDLRASR